MTVVAAGHTFFAHGTLHSGKSFTVDAGDASTPGGVVIVEGAAENDGFVTLEGSSSSAPSSAVHVTIEKNGVLTNHGDIIIGIGGGLSNDGAGPTIDIAGSLLNDNLIRFGEGYAGLADTMTIEATGTLQNTGIFYLTGGRATVGFSGVEPGATLVDVGVLTNSGTLQFFGGDTGSTYSGDGAYLDVTGQLTNAGLIQMKGAYGGLRGSYDGGTSGTLNVSGKLTNSGTIQINAANSYGYGVGTSGSTLRLQPTATLDNQGTISIGGGGIGSAGFAPPGQLSIGDGFLDNSGAIVVGGGTGGLGGDLSASGYGYALVTGTLTADGGSGGGAGGTITVNDLELESGGLIELQAGAPGSGGGALVDTFALGVEGTVLIDGGPGVSAASLTIDAGANLSDYGTISGSGTLVNNGYLSGLGSRQISVTAFYNGGTIAPEGGGTLDITGGVLTNAGQTGTLEIGYQSRFGLFGSVAAGQTAQFNGFFGPATLALGDASAFDGTLAGLGSLAIIDFLNLDVTAASSQADTLNATTSTEGVLSLAISSPLPSGTGFILSSDHAGGTDLTFK